jgi:hypothetical protein
MMKNTLVYYSAAWISLGVFLYLAVANIAIPVSESLDMRGLEPLELLPEKPTFEPMGVVDDGPLYEVLNAGIQGKFRVGVDVSPNRVSFHADRAPWLFVTVSNFSSNNHQWVYEGSWFLTPAQGGSYSNRFPGMVERWMVRIDGRARVPGGAGANILNVRQTSSSSHPNPLWTHCQDGVWSPGGRGRGQANFRPYDLNRKCWDRLFYAPGTYRSSSTQQERTDWVLSLIQDTPDRKDIAREGLEGSVSFVVAPDGRYFLSPQTRGTNLYAFDAWFTELRRRYGDPGAELSLFPSPKNSDGTPMERILNKLGGTDNTPAKSAISFIQNRSRWFSQVLDPSPTTEPTPMYLRVYRARAQDRIEWVRRSVDKERASMPVTEILEEYADRINPVARGY